MDTTVKLHLKISGSNEFKEVEVSAEELAKAIEQVKKKTVDLENSLINSNQMVQAFEQVSSAVRGLQSVMSDFTGAYSVQAAAEARLEQMMRNTMDATDEEIQSIKELAAEQQKLGVIGDEVILSGAQELATYMQKKESLEALIPVMNNMIAQQYDYNATAQSAVSVAQMLGKVFAGETGALQRLGYTFDDAQEKVLKFGTEEEKVATLTEVVGQIVEGTNAKLAASPYGQVVKTTMAYGDLKEMLGRISAPAMTVVRNIANISIAFAGVGKGVSTLKALNETLKKLAVSTKLQAAAQRMLGAAGVTAAAGTNALKIAVVGLQAAATLGLSAAIYGLIELFSALKNRIDGAKKAEEDFAEAMEEAKMKFDEEGGRIRDLINLLQDETAARADQVVAIEYLKSKYPELVEKYIDEKGHIEDLIGLQKELNRLRAGERFQTERDTLEDYKAKLADYKRLLDEIQKSESWALREVTDTPAKELLKGKPFWQDPEDYVRQQVEYYSSLVKKQQALVDKNKGTEWKAHLKDSTTQELESMLEKYQSMTSWDGKQLFQSKINDIKSELKAREKVNEQITWQEMSYADLGKAINEQKKKVEDLIGVNASEAEAEGAVLQAMQKRYDELSKQLDKVTGKVKDLAAEAKADSLEIIPELTPKTGAVSTADQGLAGSRLNIKLYDFKNLAEIDDSLSALQKIRNEVSSDMIPVVDALIVHVQNLRDEFEGVSEIRMPDISKAWNGIKGFGNSIRDIKDALTETDNAWDALTKTVDGFISLYQSLQSVIDVIKQITAATEAMQAVKDAAAAKQVANNQAETNSAVPALAAQAGKSVAGIPFVGAALAVAAIAAVIAALSSLPKFATGAVVYGPTVGLMGEYPGASSNPEVIAPLSRLRSLIGGGPGRSEVKFRIAGRELVGILNKQSNLYQRNS